MTSSQLPPILNITNPFTGSTKLLFPSLAGDGQWWKYPTPSLAGALVFASHFTEETTELCLGEVFVLYVVFPCILDQIAGECLSWVLRGSMWYFCERQLGHPPAL